ncbi:MAG: carboxypeptidase regulatory-like domain-containing protein [Thermoflexales bacterium]|nr:carboxypeptidase regulatory-like domain-containing protein [Thermoflexales bacterium]
MLAVINAGGNSLPVAQAQSPQQQEQYFPETRHLVSGEFFNFFNQHGGLKVFGYPITGEFDWRGRRIQYFQKARLELHPEQPYPYRVQLGLLGEELGYRRAGVPAVTSDQYRRFYPETQHILAYAFLTFYDANGGLDIFGYPITEFMLENGRIVQYFQRAKMEWHPELSGDQRVQLGDLGLLHFAVGGFDPRLRDPEPPRASMTVVPISLKAATSVKQPIIGRTGTQTVYVFVVDQANQPLPNANVMFIMRSLEGERAFAMPPTDARGSTVAAFNIGNLTPGQTVVIEARITYGTLAFTTQTSFMTWY